ncbi:MAG: hypothetical protein ABSD44_08005 [Terracidiphilus sp.]
MGRVSLWVRSGLAVGCVLALGYCLGAKGTVKASSNSANESNVAFQLTGVNETSSLLIYQPGTRTIYVYRGATTGNSYVQCSFKFQLSLPGDTIQRVPCDVQKLLP